MNLYLGAFSVFQFSQGSAATLISWGEWCSHSHVCHSSINPTAKTALKSIDFWRSWGQKRAGSFFTAHDVVRNTRACCTDLQADGMGITDWTCCWRVQPASVEYCGWQAFSCVVRKDYRRNRAYGTLTCNGRLLADRPTELCGWSWTEWLQTEDRVDVHYWWDWNQPIHPPPRCCFHRVACMRSAAQPGVLWTLLRFLLSWLLVHVISPLPPRLLRALCPLLPGLCHSFNLPVR